MLGNSDKDDIFPVPGYRRLADKVRTIYELYGAGDRFVLLETKGPHSDTADYSAASIPMDESLAQEGQLRGKG